MQCNSDINSDKEGEGGRSSPQRPPSVCQFNLCTSLHFATMFDILPGPTNSREEGLERKKKKHLHIHVELKNKYIEKPLSRLLFLSLFLSVFYLPVLLLLSSSRWH